MALWYLGENHTADNVMIADTPDGQVIALIERKSEPFKGCYAFPGGFVDTDAAKGEKFRLGIESPDQAALRELREEVSVSLNYVDLISIQRIGFYNDRHRDPRNSDEAWVASTAFLIHLAEPVPLTAADDAATAQWVPLSKVQDGSITLAFDHATILNDALSQYAGISA